MKIDVAEVAEREIHTNRPALADEEPRMGGQHPGDVRRIDSANDLGFGLHRRDTSPRSVAHGL